MKIMKGKLILALEGGYHLMAISNAAESVIRVLLGETLPVTNSINNKTF